MPRNVLSAMPLLATSLNFLLFKTEPRSETTHGLETQHSELQQVKLPSGRPNCNTRPHLGTNCRVVGFFWCRFSSSQRWWLCPEWCDSASEADAHTVCGFDPVRWSHLLSGADPDRPGRVLVGPAGGGRIDSIEPITYSFAHFSPSPSSTALLFIHAVTCYKDLDEIKKKRLLFQINWIITATLTCVCS